MSKALKWSDLEIIKSLGEGHAGEVLLARLRIPFLDLPEGSLVAVKRYKAWVLEERGELERVFKELDVGRRLSHPNLVRSLGSVLDHNGHPAIVMAFYEGESLDQYLTRLRVRGEFVEVDIAFSLLAGIVDALRTLHREEIVHRDVKPANILVTASGPILADLGVVKSRKLAEQTTTGAFLGTIRYAAPEYLFGEQCDFRADIYGLGAIVYELFTGREIYGEESHWARLITLKTGQPAWTPRDAAEIAQRIGMSCTEFVIFILKHSLCGWAERRLNLDNLAEALGSGLAPREWHCDGALIRPGVDTHQFPTSGSPSIGLHELVARLNAWLHPWELTLLRRLLDAHYWEPAWRPQFDDELSEQDFYTLRRIESAGAIRQFNHGEKAVTRFHPGVREAYRYRLL